MLEYVFKKIKKNLRRGYVISAGRNFLGKICVHHKGGQKKHNNYKIDFFRRINQFGFVVKIIRNVKFTAYLGFVIYQNGLSCYILLADKVSLSDMIFSGSLLLKENRKRLLIGSAMPFYYIPLFTLVNNIELKAFAGAKLIRSAGTSGVVAAKRYKKVIIKVKSGWKYGLSIWNIGTLGQVSNPKHRFYKFKKAGYMRNLGKRPVVRGVAMNPCDHPHGGGEGRKSPPAAARSPWGWLTKGTPSTTTKWRRKKNLKFKTYKF